MDGLSFSLVTNWTQSL